METTIKSTEALATTDCLINSIIRSLNEHIKKENENKRHTGNFAGQKPLHSGDMYLQLAFMNDSALNNIAAACGIKL